MVNTSRKAELVEKEEQLSIQRAGVESCKDLVQRLGVENDQLVSEME